MQGNAIRQCTTRNTRAAWGLVVIGAVAVLGSLGGQAGISVSAGPAPEKYVAGLLSPAYAGLPLSARELPYERSEKSAVFDLGHGKRAAVSIGEPLFTKDEQGEWVPIVEQGERSGGTFVFDRLAGGVDIRFDLSRPRYELTQDGRGYAVEFDAAARGEVVDDQTVAYELADGLTLRWSVEGNRVRKEIVVREKGVVKNVRFVVIPIGDVTVEVEENRIVMRDTSGRIAFETVEPFLMTTERERLDEEVRIVRGEDGDFGYEFDETDLPLPYVLDPSEGPNSPGTVANDNSVGTVAWSNPGNASASDDSYASSSGEGETTNYLKATNFGFSIPDGSTIDGVIVEIERYCNGVCNDSTIKLVKGGTVSGDNKSGGDSWPSGASEAYASFGGSADTWGLSLSATDVNASTFGAVLSALLN